MLEHLRALNELQEIDSKVFEVQEKKKALPEHLNALAAKAEDLHNQVTELKEQICTLEAGRSTHEEAISADQRRLKSWDKRKNDIRNQREYLALSREIEGTKHAQRELVENIKTSKEEEAKLTQRLEKLHDELAETEIDHSAENERIAQAQAELEIQISTLEERRKTIAPSIPTGLSRKYDRIRTQRRGMGLALVIGGSCIGCNMRLTPQHFNLLQRGTSLEQCPRCSRLLLWEKHLESSTSTENDPEQNSSSNSEA